MDTDSSSFVCDDCGGVFPNSRREAHHLMWCPNNNDDDEKKEKSQQKNDEPSFPLQSSNDMTKGWLSSVVDIDFSSIPISLRFEEQSVFGDAGTGGGVWHSELVLAERCVRDLSARVADSKYPPRILELGCGVAPAAGLVSLSLGCDVLMTDMQHLIPHVEANIRLNHEVIVNSRNSRGVALDGGLSRSSCDTDSLLFGTDLSPRVLAMCPFDWILCSDCVFRTELHDPLGHTLRELLRHNQSSFESTSQDNGSSDLSSSHSSSSCVTCPLGSGAASGNWKGAIVGFFLREPHYMDFVNITCPKYGLIATRHTELSSLYESAPWCTKADGISLDNNYRMYDISLAV